MVEQGTSYEQIHNDTNKMVEVWWQPVSEKPILDGYNHRILLPDETVEQQFRLDYEHQVCVTYYIPHFRPEAHCKVAYTPSVQGEDSMVKVTDVWFPQSATKDRVEQLSSPRTPAKSHHTPASGQKRGRPRKSSTAKSAKIAAEPIGSPARVSSPGSPKSPVFSPGSPARSSGLSPARSPVKRLHTSGLTKIERLHVSKYGPELQAPMEVETESRQASQASSQVEPRARSRRLSAPVLEQQTFCDDHIENFIIVVFALTSLMLAFVGTKKVYSFQKPVRRLQEPLMQVFDI